MSDDLAAIYMNKATLLIRLGNFQEALTLLEKSIVIWETLTKDGRPQLAKNLAMAYSNKGNALHNLQHDEEAIREHDKAISLLKRLINNNGQTELQNDLCKVYVNKAEILRAGSEVGMLEQAVSIYEEVILIREKLVIEEHRLELAGDLANAYLNLGAVVDFQGDTARGLNFAEKATDLLKISVEEYGRNDLRGEYGRGLANKAFLMVKANMRNVLPAVEVAKLAEKILMEEIERTNRVDLKAALDWLRSNFISFGQ